MANLFKLDAGKYNALMTKLASAGFTVEMAEEVLKNPSLAQVIVSALKAHPAFALVHGVFNKSADVLAATNARLAQKGIDLAKLVWSGPQTPPGFTDDPEVVVTLTDSLGSLEETMNYYWEWTKEGQADAWRYEGLAFDSKNLALIEGAAFQPFTRRWVKIKLNVNVDKKPGDVRDPKLSPGWELLAVAAQHPERIKATDYEKRFGFYLAGIRCTVPGHEPWSHVPYVYFSRGSRRVRLRADWHDRGHSYLAVPAFRE